MHATPPKKLINILIYIEFFFNRAALNLFKSFSNPRARKTPVDNFDFGGIFHPPDPPKPEFASLTSRQLGGVQ